MKFNDFQVLGEIGRGGFGTVLLCKSKKNVGEVQMQQLVAMKLILKNKKKSVQAEINVMKKLKNRPFTSQLLGSFQDRLDAFIVIALYENGSLANIIEKNGAFDIESAHKIIVDILLGLQEMHRIDILHGDVKPDNILIDKNGRANVADFGLARNFKEDPVKGLYGTPGYQSPEQFTKIYLTWLQEMHRIDILHGDVKPDNILIDKNGRANVADFGLARNFKEDPVKGLYGTPGYQSPEQFTKIYLLDERINIFNAGIIFYEMITAKHPFVTTNDPNDVEKNIVSLKFPMPTLKSNEAISFINKTLCEASRRLNVNNVMEHPFIKPIIESARVSFEWPTKIINTENCRTCFTNKNVEDISGISKEIESLHIANSKHDQKTDRANGHRHASNRANHRHASNRANRRHDNNRTDRYQKKVVNVTEILQKKLVDAKGENVARLSKVGRDYYVVCGCTKRLKVVAQDRGIHKRINYTIQPYKRHIKRH